MDSPTSISARSLRIKVRRRTAVPAVIAAASIAISFYKPSLALIAYRMLLVFYFLAVQHHRPPAIND
jgi:hypothetical protein